MKFRHERIKEFDDQEWGKYGVEVYVGRVMFRRALGFANLHHWCAIIAQIKDPEEWRDRNTQEILDKGFTVFNLLSNSCTLEHDCELRDARKILEDSGADDRHDYVKVQNDYPNYHITETGDTIELQHIGTIDALHL